MSDCRTSAAGGAASPHHSNSTQQGLSSGSCWPQPAGPQAATSQQVVRTSLHVSRRRSVQQQSPLPRTTTMPRSVVLLAAAVGCALIVGADAQTKRGPPRPVQPPQKPCLGDTRGDRKCAHDSTHRVCARIGDPQTSFWRFTGQHSWCNTRGSYYGRWGNNMRCPASAPTWCICKWATASWIKGAGCGPAIKFDCDATDICATTQGLFFSYNDFNVNLRPAHSCAKLKCPKIWRELLSSTPPSHGHPWHRSVSLCWRSGAAPV